MKNRLGSVLPSVFFVLILSGISFSQVTKAICVLQPTDGNKASGTVTFTQTDTGVLLSIVLTGLTPGKHGFHVHEFGDCTSKDGTSAGGHFNPMQMEHGSPEADTRHAGDFGNVEADKNGNVKEERLDKQIMLEGEFSVIGRSLVVHADADDLKTQPTGNAGKRVAYGVIGIAK
ncbi:superoxide dismutase family protein [bacterium]|nr:superoxide dismutase family protein [bacterium]